MTRANADPYEITAEALAAAARFVEGLNKLIAETGVSVEFSYGGVSVGHMSLGDLRSAGDGVVLDVRHG